MGSLVYRAGPNIVSEQHPQRVVAVHRGQTPVAPALGRKPALQRPHHARNQEQLQPGNQHRLGNLTRVAGRLGDVQPVDGGVTAWVASQVMAACHSSVSEVMKGRGRPGEGRGRAGGLRAGIMGVVWRECVGGWLMVEKAFDLPG